MNNFSTLFKPRALAQDLTIHLVMAPTVFKNKLFTKLMLKLMDCTMKTIA